MRQAHRILEVCVITAVVIGTPEVARRKQEDRRRKPRAPRN